MGESQNKILHVKNIKAKVFEGNLIIIIIIFSFFLLVILRYIYFLEVPIELDTAEELLVQANGYMIKKLKDVCEELLLRWISKGNVVKRT